MKRTGSGKPRPRSARVVWDEANLEYLEASKSPKKKITEPKTPYHAPENEDGTVSPIADEASLDSAVHAEQIRNALSEVASTSTSQRRPRGGGWTSSEDEADEMDQDLEDLKPNGRCMSFEDHRKAHYDEYRKVKSLRSSNSHDAEEEDDNQPQDTAQGNQDHEGTLEGDMGAFGLQESPSSTLKNCGT